MVSPSHPCRTVWRCQKGLDFWTRQIADEFLVRPLHGDGQDTGHDAEAVGIPQGHEAEKGPQGGQTNIAGADGVAVFLLQIVEKAQHARDFLPFVNPNLSSFYPICTPGSRRIRLAS